MARRVLKQNPTTMRMDNAKPIHRKSRRERDFLRIILALAEHVFGSHAWEHMTGACGSQQAGDMVYACVAMNEARGLTRKSTVQTPGIVGNGFRSFVGRVRRPDIRDSQRRRRGMSGLRGAEHGQGPPRKVIGQIVTLPKVAL
ncbi:MAG: hypothetical protein KAV00_01115, partial [Phycisphaerae bacterium]|nr:hypothetical protein [Phycisphaerae bacterium]